MNRVTPLLALASSIFWFTGEALAEYCRELPIQPIISINNKCPSNYNRSNGYCLPNKDAVPVLLPMHVLPDSCPLMFIKDNGFCKAIKKEIGSIIVPPIAEKCPMGYIKFDNYCKQSCPLK
jgi:hypothetical protein